MIVSELLNHIQKACTSSDLTYKATNYLKLIEIDEAFNRVAPDKLELDSSLLITPFYIDKGIYELFYYEMNLQLIENPSNENQSCDDVSTWLIELWDSLTLHKVSKDNPFITKEVFLKYFEFLKTSFLIKSDIVRAFRCKPQIDKLYLAFY